MFRRDYVSVSRAMVEFALSRGFSPAGGTSRKGSALVLRMSKRESCPAAPGFDFLEWRPDHPGVLFAFADEVFNGKRSPRMMGSFLEFVCPVRF